MILYDKLFSYYGSISPNDGEGGRITEGIRSLCRFFLRIAMSKVLLPLLYKNKKRSMKKESDLIVSLTSFPARLETLWLTIESIKHQDVLPEKIVLYLIDEEVTRERVPQKLLDEEDELFEIRFRSTKMRAHGKYHYAMQDFPDAIIVTVDDDMIYPPHMLSIMLESHRKYPNSVLTNQTTQIQLSEDGHIKPYTEWKWSFNAKDYSDGFINLDRLIPLGVCGAMYPPHLLYKDVLNFELAKKLSYLADDLWLYAMTVLSQHKVVKTPLNPLEIVPIDIKNNTTLFSVNGGDNQNDVQFKQIRDYYLKNEGLDII